MVDFSDGTQILSHDNGAQSRARSSGDTSQPERQGRYTCTVCSTSFRRREHFTRHMNVHAQSRDFKCDICDKHFTRKDTLQRHTIIHGQGAKKSQGTIRRVQKACLNCVKRKQRCSGSYPCGRCEHKDWPCKFPKRADEADNDDQEIIPAPFRSDTNLPPLESNTYPGSSQQVPVEDSFVDYQALPHGDIGLSSQASEIAPSGDTSSLLDSFLLWPLDDPFEQAEPSIPEPLASQAYTHVQPATLTDDDRDILISEDYGHTPRPSTAAYQAIEQAHLDVHRYSQDDESPSLYPLEISHVCVQLFFEHFNQLFPIIHQGTFRVHDSSWRLYLAMAAIGSQYSRLSIRLEIFASLMKTLRMSMLQLLNSPPHLQNNLELAQTTLLFNFALLFGGSRENVMYLQYQRNMLVTMCRPLLTPGVLFEKCGLPNAISQGSDWNIWIKKECWKRVVYYMWLSECLQLILFDLPPLVTIWDINICMPCDDDLWTMANSNDWERARALLSDESPSFNNILQMRLSQKECMRSLSDQAITVSMFGLYTAERQSSQQRQLTLQHDMRSPFASLNHPPTRHPSPTDMNRTAIDTTLENFQRTITHKRQHSPITSLVTKFSLLLRMLRFIPYRSLYISTGWMAQAYESDVARGNISQTMNTKPRQARQSLLHAAQIFGIISSQTQYEPYDSFVLLMAVLYIWNYDKFAMPGMMQSLPDVGSRGVFRIDQTMDERLQKDWVAGLPDTQRPIHISGIGVLNGRDSVPRILKEAIRILYHDKAWSRQASGIKQALRQMLQGDAPSFSAATEN